MNPWDDPRLQVAPTDGNARTAPRRYANATFGEVFFDQFERARVEMPVGFTRTHDSNGKPWRRILHGEVAASVTPARILESAATPTEGPDDGFIDTFMRGGTLMAVVGATESAVAAGPGLRFMESAVEMWDTAGDRSLYLNGGNGSFYFNGSGTFTGNVTVGGVIAAGVLKANVVNTTNLVAGSVTTGILAAGAVTATKIAANTITATQIAAGAISATELAADSVTSTKIITGVAIAALTITTTNLDFRYQNGPCVFEDSVSVYGFLNALGGFAESSTRDSNKSIKPITLAESLTYLEAAEPVTYVRPVDYGREKSRQTLAFDHNDHAKPIRVKAKKNHQFRQASVMAESLRDSGLEGPVARDAEGALIGVNIGGQVPYLIPALKDALRRLTDQDDVISELRDRVARLEAAAGPPESVR